MIYLVHQHGRRSIVWYTNKLWPLWRRAVKKICPSPTPFSVDFYKYPHIYMTKMTQSTVYIRNIDFVYF